MVQFEEKLQEEIQKEWERCQPVDAGVGLESAVIVNEQFEDIARHFVEWTKKQLLDVAEDHTLTGYNVIRYDVDALKQRGINFGDKVKVIIIKED